MAAIHNYFLGALSPTGFSSFFEQLVDNDFALRTYILKAGPGCGKSSLMRRIADRIIAAGHDFEMIHCASDPLSLDGLICRDLNFAIVDGTAPHVLEPSIPAAKQKVVSLYHCIDNKQITASFGKLRPLFDLNAQYLARAKRFIAAAGSLHYDIERTAANALIPEKVARYAKNLAAKTFPKKSEKRGTETLRLSCAYTPAGIIDFTESNYSNCLHTHIFEDRFAAYAHLILDNIRDLALAGGCAIVTSRSAMSAYDKIDAVYIPALDTVFAHSSYISGVSIANAHVVRDQRFYNTEIIGACQKRLNFCKKATVELLDEACSLLSDAKRVHDDIEEYYKSSVDFVKVREQEKEICTDIGLEP